MKSVMKEKTHWAMSMFMTICSEKKFPWIGQVPNFVHRAALEDGQEEEGEMGDYEEAD